MQLTEQQSVIISAAKTSTFLKINAFAGTGKTTVLEKLTETYSDSTFLYLVFNKAMADAAEKRFGKNTNVCTINSLAYQYTRNELQLRGVRNNGYRVIEIKNHYNLTDSDITYMIIRLFDAFCNSSYKDINTDIIKTLIYENADLTVKLKKAKPSLTKITNGVLSMWNDMYHKRLEPLHGFYLKYFHLSIQRMKQHIVYDYVLLDECQDTNAIVLDVFNALSGKKIIVGDKWQQIYSFRGTVNAMESFSKVSDQRSLSHTFRFNNAIAEKANFILNNILGEPESIISYFPDRYEDVKTKCYITRTNAGIVSLFSKFYDEGKIVKTVRVPDDIFRLPLSLYYYLSDRHRNKDKIEVKWLWSFNGRNDIKEYAQEAGDIEMLTSLRLVEEYWDNLIEIYKNAKANRKKRKVDIFLTTAHTCKGLEWDEVFIHDDFPDLLMRTASVASSIEDFKIKISEKDTIQNSSLQKVIEEWNLYYVAITRGLYNVNLSLPNSQIFGLSTDELDSILIEHKKSLATSYKR